MRTTVLFLCFLAIAFSCNEKVVEPPENLIAKEKMINILYDLAIINAGKATDPQVLEGLELEPMQFIYDKYGIDSVQFVTSDLYYASLPLEYEKIYKALEARLELEKERIEKEREAANDSVRKASEISRTN